MGSEATLKHQIRSTLQKDLADRIAKDQSVVLDRFGRPIVEGCAVVYEHHPIPAYRVVSIVPDMHPQAPSGALKMKLSLELTIIVMPYTPLPQIITASMPERMLKAMQESGEMSAPPVGEQQDQPESESNQDHSQKD